MDLKKVTGNLGIKKIGKNQILILFLCGILLMIISIPVKEDTSHDRDSSDAEGESLSETLMTENTEYTQYLEHELEQMLHQMEDVGDVACMVTLSQSAEQVIEKDMETSNENITESDSQGGTRTTNQSSKSETTIYHDEEKGEPYIRKEISPKVEGVLVIADGGDNAVVVKNITESIQALFGIESHKIRIVKKGGSSK